MLNDPKVMCNSFVFVLFWFFLHFSFGGGGGRSRWHKGFFFFIVGIFSNYQLKICTEIQLYAFCIFKACFLNLSRVIVFKEPAQPVTCLKKIYLHFEVPFECHSLDLASILFNCYAQAPQVHDAGWHRTLKTLGKACALALGEGREQNLCI